MKEEIKIPALGESINEVTVASFLKKSGSSVNEGDELIELETEKVNQVLYASAPGVVEWKVKEGDTIPIGAVIGHIDTEKKGEKEPAPPKASPPKTPPKEEIKKEEKPKVSESEVNLRKKEEDFVAGLKQKPVQKQESLPKPTPKKEGKESRRKMTKIRQTIASRLVEALNTAAMLTTFNEADMSVILDLRNKYKESFQKKYGVKLGFMSFFVKAVVEALKAFPDFNSYIDRDEVVERHYYDIGIAVGTERGLVVPVVRGADNLNFAEIEKKIEEYALKARSGKLSIDDLQGGGFTITNGGVYGSLLSTPILNPPQVGILGMHKIMKRAVVVNEEIAIRPMMYLALSYDHRLVDGKDAVSFLVHIKESLEDPSRLILFENDGHI